MLRRDEHDNVAWLLLIIRRLGESIDLIDLCGRDPDSVGNNTDNNRNNTWSLALRGVKQRRLSLITFLFLSLVIVMRE